MSKAHDIAQFVVGVCSRGIDHSVPEVDGLLRIVPYSNNVTHRVESVVKILEDSTAFRQLHSG